MTRQERDRFDEQLGAPFEVLDALLHVAAGRVRLIEPGAPSVTAEERAERERFIREAFGLPAQEGE